MLGLTSEKSAHPASLTQAAPVLIPTGSSQDQAPFVLDRRCVLVGATESADLQLFFGGVQDAHALIVTGASGVYVRSLAGQNGLRINGLPITEHFLNDGDAVQFGQFSFVFRAQGARFQPRTPPPMLGIQIAGQPRQIRGRIALIGVGFGPWGMEDIQTAPADTTELHAALFAADGKWHVRELGSAGVSVNGRAVRVAELKAGDQVGANGCELNITEIIPPRAPAAPAAAMAELAVPEIFLGGMPVTLPEVGPPEGFGQVRVSFTGKPFSPAAPAPKPVFQPLPEPAEETEKSVPMPAPQTAAPPPAPPEIKKPSFPPPLPRVKLPKPAAPQEAAEETPEPESVFTYADAFAMPEWDEQSAEGEFPLGLQDTVFGPGPLAGGGEEYIPDTSGTAGQFTAEVEDLSDHDFWNRSEQDPADIPLPTREKNLTPPIPPAEPGAAAATFVPSQDRSFQPHLRRDVATTKDRGAPPEFRRRDGTPLATNLKPVRTSLLSPRAKVGLVGLCAAAGVGLAVWIGMPAHYTLEGRLRFLNTPAISSLTWAPFEADQRSRLTDSTLPQAAGAKLQADHPEAAPGFLAGTGTGAYTQMVQSARFEPSKDGCDLVLRVQGSDWNGDSERLTSVLKALYDRENDLTGAAAAVRKELSDWLPNVSSKQNDLDQILGRIAEQQKFIDAASGLTDTLPGLLTAATTSGQKYLAAEKIVQKDETRLEELNARAARPVAKPASTQPSTLPLAADESGGIEDDALTDFNDRIEQLSEQNNAVQSLRGGTPQAQFSPALQAISRKLDHDLSEAEDLLDDHSELQQALGSAGELQGRVRDVLTQLSDHRAAVLTRLQAIDSLLDQTSRRHEEIIQHTKTATAQVGRRQPDPTLHLSNVLERLVDGAAAELDSERQLVDVTLQTEQERLTAPGTPIDLVAGQRAALGKALQDISDADKLESDYAKALAQVDPMAAALPSTQDELEDLKNQATSRKRILAAARISESRDTLMGRLTADLTAMEIIQAGFYKDAAAASAAASALQSAHQAQQAMGVLLENRDAKQGDLAAVQQNSENIKQTIASTVDLKQPTESDVQVVLDDSARKWTYLWGAWLLIAAAVIVIAGKRTGPTARGRM